MPPSCSRTTACCGNSAWPRTARRSGPTPRAYNRFVADVCDDGAGRLFGVAHVLLHDPAWAVEEIRRVRAQGVRLAMIAPAPVDGKPLSHPDFDPVWAAFSDEGVAPVFHVSDFESPLHPAWRTGEQEEGEQLFDSIFLYLAPAVALANLILTGTLERFPDLRIGVVELTASWVPHFLLHIDGASDFYTLRHGEPFHKLSDRPSNYFLRQVRVAALPYEMPNRLVPKVGDDTYMLGSDWPHAEGVADPMAQAQRAVAGLPEPAPGQHVGRQRSVAPRPVTVDLEAAAAERERLRATYLREPAGAPALDGTRRAPCGAVVLRRRADDPLLSGPARLPFGRALREPRLQGVDAPLLRSRPRQHARLLRFSGPRSRAVRGGAGRLPPPRHLRRPGPVGRGAERLDEAGIPTQIESEISLYFSDPDGVRLELIAEDLGSLYGTPLH